MGIVKTALSATLAPLGYEIVKKRRVAAHSESPSILLVTLPKSGSIFLYKTLSKNLNLESIDVSPGYFPIDNLDLRAILEFAKGGYIAQTHINVSPFNLNLLSRLCDKWIVHLRDPRAALLSWTHHKDRSKIYQDPKMALRNFPQEPDIYYSSMSFSEKIDWQIENYLPQIVRWIDEWCAVIDSEAFSNKIVVTSYERLVGRDEDFIRDVMNSLGLSQQRSIQLAAKDMSSHYRQGSLDEWCSAFTPAQIQNASNKISDRLKERFGWVKI